MKRPVVRFKAVPTTREGRSRREDWSGDSIWTSWKNKLQKSSIEFMTALIWLLTCFPQVWREEHLPREQDHDANAGENTVLPDRVWNQGGSATLLLMSDPKGKTWHKDDADCQ